MTTTESSPSSPLSLELMALVRGLYPICRSITGNGVRETLRLLSSHIPLEVHEVASGTQVLDWTIPNEWNIRDAWVKNSAGERVLDFAASNLHVVSYSIPVRRRMTLAELRPHLHTLPDQPDRIPYRTSYYEATWGLCLPQRVLDQWSDGPYEVCIDSTLEPGSLTYGELVLHGSSEDEILISAHVCHPSLADDNLSGLSVAALLAKHLLAGPKPRHTLRFLFAPGTIGAITWLARNRDRTQRIRGGLTVTCLGDSHPFSYKRSLKGDCELDRIAEHVLRAHGASNAVIDFFPYGYDERQFNSPGFRIPVGCLMRGRHGMFAEYHTSGDNLDFVSGARLEESYRVLRQILATCDANRAYMNLAPMGEPQLGRRGLYRALGGSNLPNLQLALLWVLNLSDGDHTLLDIAERSGLDFETVLAAARLLETHDLLRA